MTVKPPSRKLLHARSLSTRCIISILLHVCLATQCRPATAPALTNERSLFFRRQEGRAAWAARH